MVTPSNTYAPGIWLPLSVYLPHPLAAYSVTVSRVINQWIPLLAHHLRGLIKWPKTKIGTTDTPYNHMPNTVGIIDGTEIFIQRPSNLATQKSSYSDYKSHTTVKYLVAIDPFTGVFTSVSPGSSGNSSDLLWKAVLSLICFSQVSEF